MMNQHAFCLPYQEDASFIGESFKPKILIIEDNALIRRDLVSILKRASYEVFQAQNGTIGLTKAYQYLPDLVLCDFDLPDITAKELLRQIREDPYLSQIKIVLCTGRLDIETVLPFVNACITKPYTKEQILCTVTMLVYEHTSNEQTNTNH